MVLPPPPPKAVLPGEALCPAKGQSSSTGSFPKRTAPLPPPPKRESKVQVVRFDAASFGLRPTKGKRVEEDVSAPEQETSTGRTSFDRQEDKFDKDVSNILTLLTSVEDLAGSQLVGKERNAFMKQKLQKLGLKVDPPKKPPFKILKGIREKEKVRKEKQKEQMRELGLLSKYLTGSKKSKPTK